MAYGTDHWGPEAGKRYRVKGYRVQGTQYGVHGSLFRSDSWCKAKVKQKPDRDCYRDALSLLGLKSSGCGLELGGRVSGFGFRVSYFGPGFGFRASAHCCHLPTLRTQGSGFGFWGAGFRVQKRGSRAEVSESIVWGSEHRLQGSSSRVKGLRLRFQNPGSRVQSLGSCVKGLASTRI
eukprot:3306390-Rhodomonas_salina.2